MVKSKPSHPPEGNELKTPTEGNKGQASKANKYGGKKPQNKPILEPKTKTDSQGRCTDLEGYTFDLGPWATDKFARTMKELEIYPRTIYSESCQPDIMTETAANFPDPEMPTITELGIERPKIDGEMTYLEKKNTNEAIRLKLRKKDVYKSDMHKINNLILGQTNEKLQEKAASDATFQAVKTDQDPIGYPMTLKRIYFSNKSKQHPICSLWLSTRRLYNTMQYANENTTDYLVRFRNAHKVNEVCDGIRITKGVQEHGMKILFPLKNTGFYSLQEYDKKEAEKEGEEILCAIYTWRTQTRPGYSALFST